MSIHKMRHCMATREHANPPISIPPQYLTGSDNENFGLIEKDRKATFVCRRADIEPGSAGELPPRVELRGADPVISIREQITIASPPDAVWPLLSDPALVASCIPGATLTKHGDDGAYQGTMRVKFGPTVAQFRGEAKLAYDHAARRCTI